MPSSDWRPSVADVGAILRARTKDTTGTELGTFTADTRPTAAEVELIIAQALSDVELEVGEELPDRLHDTARRTVALGAAVTIELSYWPEQVALGRSPYAQLLALYQGSAGHPGALARLTAALAETGTDGAGDESPFGDHPVMHSFPADAGGVVGWGTRW